MTLYLSITQIAAKITEGNTAYVHHMLIYLCSAIHLLARVLSATVLMWKYGNAKEDISLVHGLLEKM